VSLPVAVQGLQLQPGLLEQWSDLIAQQVAVEEAPLQRFATLVRDVLVRDIELLAGSLPAASFEDVETSTFKFDGDDRLEPLIDVVRWVLVSVEGVCRVGVEDEPPTRGQLFGTTSEALHAGGVVRQAVDAAVGNQDAVETGSWREGAGAVESAHVGLHEPDLRCVPEPCRSALEQMRIYFEAGECDAEAGQTLEDASVAASEFQHLPRILADSLVEGDVPGCSAVDQFVELGGIGMAGHSGRIDRSSDPAQGGYDSGPRRLDEPREAPARLSQGLPPA